MFVTWWFVWRILYGGLCGVDYMVVSLMFFILWLMQCFLYGG